MDFNKGLKDGIPVALGYFSVSIAFGLMAIENECSALEAVLISVTNLTSAGQFAGVTVLAAMGTYVEMAMTQLIINSRYSLMAISLSQKVDGKFRGVWKWLLGFAITDEIFAVAIGHDGSISKEYFSGLISLPILGWSAGTLFGAVLGNIMPEIITTSLGIALYGMFIAVVVPKARENRHVLITVILAIIISTGIRHYYQRSDRISGRGCILPGKGGRIMDMLTFLPYLLVMAGVTYLIRALPFVLVNKKIENRFLNSFLYYIPYTVLAAMTFPAILYGTNHMISAIAGLAVAVFIAYKGKGLLIVAVGACSAVFVAELVLMVVR